MGSIRHAHLNFPGYWRLCWFGWVRNHEMYPSTRCIDVFMQEIVGRSNLSAPISYQAIDSPLKRVQVPIAEVTQLYINSVVHDGLVQGSRHDLAPGEHKASVKFDFGSTEKKFIHRFEHDDAGKPYIPYAHSPLIVNDNAFLMSEHGAGAIEPPGVVRKANGYFVLLSDREEGIRYAIPCYEIFRFFYGLSSRLAESVIAGYFGDPRSHLWKDAQFDDASKTAVLRLHRKMFNADAMNLACFAFSETAQNHAKDIGIKLSRESALEQDKPLLANVPFEEEMGLNLIYLERQGIRVVTRILTSDWRPNFSRVIYFRDTPQNKLDNTDGEGVEVVLPPLYIETNARSETDTTPLSEGAAMKHLPAKSIHESEFGERFPKLAKIPLVRAPQIKITHRSGKRLIEFLDDQKISLTTIVVPGHSDMGNEIKNRPVVITSGRHESSEVVDSDLVNPNNPTILMMIKMLKKEQSVGVRIEFVNPFSEVSYIDGVELGVFPVQIDQKIRSWSFISKEPTKRRQVLVAKICFKNKTRYIIDVEQKIRGESAFLVFLNKAEGDIPIEEIRMGLLVSAIRRRLDFDPHCSAGNYRCVRMSHREITSHSGALFFHNIMCC